MFDVFRAIDSTRITAETIRQLQAHLRGDLLLPGDDGYETARRVWNGAIDRRPALIVRAAGAAEVLAAIDVVGTYGLSLSIRGGGHGVAGHAIADDGLTIDLSGMRGVRVDPERMTVRVEAGARGRPDQGDPRVPAGDPDRQAARHGRRRHRPRRGDRLAGPQARFGD